MNRFITLSILLCCLVYAKAERVSYKDAEKVARAYYYQTVNAFKTTEWNDINISCVVNPNDANPKYNLYIFDVNGDEGYIVVSSDNRITPVLAYSFECPFNLDNMSPGQAGFINYYSESNDNANKTDVELAEKNIAEWSCLLTYNPLTKETRDVVTSPILLDGIVWEQGWPFNSMCPEYTNDYNNHAPVGVVATATCHVMKYWNWPPSGTGSYTHSSLQNGGNGNITVNFANETYDWYSIPDDPSNVENTELGKICFHVGVAEKMQWAADGSGSQTSEVPDALKTYFKYATDATYKTKSTYTDANWSTLLKEQIDQKYPMVYSGSPEGWGSAGHAWNCDGYQINGDEEKFHMQWGWGVNGGNGYYTLDNLQSTAVSGDEYNFSNSQEVVINIHPDQDFSECQSITITASEGTFDDGSRAYDYANDKDCIYTIMAPENEGNECVSKIKLTFNKFDLSEGDNVSVYNGNDDYSNLLATYDNNNLPNGTITSTENTVIIKFHTDSQDVSDGWRLDYKCIEGPYTISVQSSNTQMGRVNGGGRYPCGNTVRLTAIPTDCYCFKNWSDGSTDSTFTITATRDVSYIAYFELCNGQNAEIISDETSFCSSEGQISAAHSEVGEGSWSSSVPDIISFDEPNNPNTAVHSTVLNNGSEYNPYTIYWTVTNGDCVATDSINVTFGRTPYYSIDTTVSNFVTVGDHTFYSTGNYTFTVPSETGCDTIYDLQLRVLAEPVYNIGPNPTKSLLNINSDSFISAVEFYSITGQVVMRKEVNGYEVEFDVECFADGVYILRIYGEENSLPSVYKVVKE